MTEEEVKNRELAEMQELRDMFAGLALPGVMMRASSPSHSLMARDAYAIAQAMVNERTSRIKSDSSTPNLPQNESIH